VDKSVENSVQNVVHRWTTRGTAVNPPVEKTWMYRRNADLTCGDVDPRTVDQNS
jgi:hypothetical protein